MPYYWIRKRIRVILFSSFQIVDFNLEFNNFILGISYLILGISNFNLWFNNFNLGIIKFNLGIINIKLGNSNFNLPTIINTTLNCSTFITKCINRVNLWIENIVTSGSLDYRLCQTVVHFWLMCFTLLFCWWLLL